MLLVYTNKKMDKSVETCPSSFLILRFSLRDSFNKSVEKRAKKWIKTFENPLTKGFGGGV